ncbi:MAG: xanthine dehydrogenase family protein subunit M [Chloroflexi bacterium]|nr:xanthine dehydrogenase family protein subunit M [Chloroflexota bacterium]
MRPFEYFAPTSLQEAIDVLRQRGDGGRPLAGGTDLVVQMKEGVLRFPYPEYVVSLRRLPELKGMDFSEATGLRLGAGATFAEVAESPVVRERYPIIAEGASIVGSVQTMNMATVGGNLCNAAPSADIAPPLLACEATARIAGPSGQRTVPLDEFFVGPGETVLRPGELLVEVLVPPPPPRTGGAYRRHTPRKQMDIAVVGVAALVTLGPSTSSGQADGGAFQRVRLALGAVAPTPVRARNAEARLEGRPASDEAIAGAAAIAHDEAKPISDVRGSAAFRRHLVGVMTERLLKEAVARARR